MVTSSKGNRPWEAALRGFEQAWVDISVSRATEVTFIRIEDDAEGFVDAVEQRALQAGFVVSALRLSDDIGFEALDALVRAFASYLRHGDRKAGEGLTGLLDTFAKQHGRRALEAFDEAADQYDATGELTTLARSYLESANAPRDRTRLLRAWIDGRAFAKLAADEVRPLSARTAKAALAELSRLVLTLGHAGLVLICDEAEAIPSFPPARRDGAYTVLRELCDNTDSERGLISTKLMVFGRAPFFEGRRSYAEHGALLSRIGEPIPFESAPPHAACLRVGRSSGDGARGAARRTQRVPEREQRGLAALIRLGHGLPPTDVLAELTVGLDAIDGAVDSLFAHASHDGSVFAVVSGEYGSGKTHLMSHLRARALADKRPVFTLAVERLDTDLGNPQRHLRRLLEASLVPVLRRDGSWDGRSASPLERLSRWTQSASARKQLAGHFEEIVAADSESAMAIRRAPKRVMEDDAALKGFLGGHDLESKPGQPNYRHDAYARLLLWAELLRRQDDLEGPVVLIDEGENLYRAGVSKSERRTALRTLAFYCGGVLPRACVVLAVTPDTLAALREEAETLLDEVDEAKTALVWEDPTMLRRRLLRSRPMSVKKLDDDELTELAKRVRTLHESVRGRTMSPAAFRTTMREAIDESGTPRELLRSVVERLETAWWTQ